jgi:hypothetical protein
MRRLLPTIALLCGAAAWGQEDEDQGPIPADVICREQRATCREDCTLDFGTQESTRNKVPQCLANCDQGEIVCLARHVAKRHAGKAPARDRYTPVEETEASPDEVDLPPVRRRTSTRAAELKPAPNRNPEAYQESTSSRPVPGEVVEPPVKQPVERLDPPPPRPAPVKVEVEVEDGAKAKPAKKKKRQP